MNTTKEVVTYHKKGENKMKDLGKLLGASVGMTLITIFAYGSILFGVWNALAWQFNFAPLGWWTCVGIEALVYHLCSFFKPKKGE